MKVSIITVCYNSEATIRDTIESVLTQSYANIEYIIIDGNSTDSTLSIINEYGEQIATVVSENDKGIYDAMNKGIAIASGEIIGILNSDDFYENNEVIATVMNTFQTLPASDLVFGNIVFVKPKELNKVVRCYDAKHFKPWKLRFGWMPPHPATFIRKAVYNECGLYALDYKISSDYEMFVRLLLIEKRDYTYMNQTLVKMRSGGVSTAGLRSNLLLNKEIVKACRTNGIYTNIFMVLTKIPFKMLELVKKKK